MTTPATWERRVLGIFQSQVKDQKNKPVEIVDYKSLKIVDDKSLPKQKQRSLTKHD